MKLLIDVDEKLYNRIKCLEPRSDSMLDILMRAVQSGKALEQEPKTGRWVHSNNYESYIPKDYVITLLEDKKRTRKEITNRIYECVGVQVNEDNKKDGVI